MSARDELLSKTMPKRFNKFCSISFLFVFFLCVWNFHDFVDYILQEIWYEVCAMYSSKFVGKLFYAFAFFTCEREKKRRKTNKKFVLISMLFYIKIISIMLQQNFIINLLEEIEAIEFLLKKPN